MITRMTRDMLAGPAITVTPAVLARWRRKARQVFTMRARNNDGAYDRQSERAVDLARDLYRTLDPAGWRRPK